MLKHHGAIRARPVMGAGQRHSPWLGGTKPASTFSKVVSPAARQPHATVSACGPMLRLTSASAGSGWPG